jgi:hypothetical protein
MVLENLLPLLRGQVFANRTGVLHPHHSGSTTQSCLYGVSNTDTAKLLKAPESLDAGRGVDGEQVFARLRQRSKSRRPNA